jgi:hypothetical protein
MNYEELDRVQPIALEPEDSDDDVFTHKHSFQVVANDTTFLRYCQYCTLSHHLVDVTPSGKFTPSYEWQPIKESEG